MRKRERCSASSRDKRWHTCTHHYGEQQKRGPVVSKAPKAFVGTRLQGPNGRGYRVLLLFFLFFFLDFFPQYPLVRTQTIHPSNTPLYPPPSGANQIFDSAHTHIHTHTHIIPPPQETQISYQTRKIKIKIKTNNNYYYSDRPQTPNAGPRSFRWGAKPIGHSAPSV